MLRCRLAPAGQWPNCSGCSRSNLCSNMIYPALQVRGVSLQVEEFGNIRPEFESLSAGELRTRPFGGNVDISSTVSSSSLALDAGPPQ